MDYFFYNTDANSLSRDGRFPILIKGGFAATSGPWRFGEELGKLSPGDRVLMYENKRGVVAVGTVLEHWDHKTHRPPLYYQPGDDGFDDDGFDYEYRIKVDWFLDLSHNPVSVKELKQRASTPRGAIARIVKWRHEIETMIEERSTSQLFPGEVPDSSSYVEGATRRISVNAYERNLVARSRCIEHYGKNCVVCDFNFGEAFGPLVDGFIHVHHLKPLSEIGEEYEVDPITDLRPVCPNCHAVIHLGGECRTIESVRELRKKNKAQDQRMDQSGG